MVRKQAIVANSTPSWLRAAGRLLSGLVLLFGLLVTAAWWTVDEYERRLAESQRFDGVVDDVMSRLQDRLASFEQALRGVAVLKGSSPHTGEHGWSMFVERLDLTSRFPGLVGVGFSEKVADEELESHIASQRQLGLPRYDVTPAGKRSVYYPLVHIAPANSVTTRRLGFDGYADPTRRLAMDRALRTSEPAYTATITLSVDDQRNPIPGFIVYMPAYALGAKAYLGQPELGFVSGGFRIEPLLQSITEGHDDIEVSMFTERLELAPGLRGQASSSAMSVARSFTRGGQAWSLRVTARPNFFADRSAVHGLNILLIGALLSFGAAAITAVVDRKRRRAEIQLLTSRNETERKFHELADGAPFIMWMTDGDFNATFLNTRWTEFTGLTIEQSLGKGWGQAIHPDDIEGMLAKLAITTQTGTSLDVEFRLRGSDGAYRWMASQGEPSFGPDGEVLRYAGTCVDVTERRLAAEAIRRVQDQYRLAVEASGTGVWHIDTVGDRAIVNRRFLDMLGLPIPSNAIVDGDVWIIEQFRESPVAIDFETHMHPDDRVVRTAALKALLREGQTMRLQLRLCDGEGEYRWFAFHGDAQWDEHGRPTSLFGAVVDITERKHIEDVLEQERAFLSDVFDAIPVPLYVKNQKHEWVVLNKACGTLNGCSYDEMRGKSDYDFHPPERAARYAAQDNQVFASTEALVVEESYADTSGRLHWIQKSKKAITTRKGERIIVGANIDITDRKLAEQSAQEGRQFLVSILDAIPNPIFVKDAQHRFLLTNEAFAKLLNVRAEDLIGKSDADYFAPEVAALRVEEDKSVFAAGGPKSFEMLMDSPTAPRWSLKNKSPFRLPDGQSGIVGIVTDITGLKNAEAARKAAMLDVERSHAFLSSIINAIPAQIYVKDMAHRFLLVNDSFADWAGVSIAETIGKTDGDFVEPQLADKIWDEDERALAGDAPVVFETLAGSKVMASAWWHKTKRGVALPGGERCLVGINIDITTRKRDEEMVRASSKRLHLLNQLSTHVAGGLPYEQIMKKAVDALGDVVGAKVCYGVLEADNVVMVYPTPEEACGSSRELVTYNLSAAPEYGAALRGGRFLNVADIEQEPRLKAWRRTLRSVACRSMLSIPIRLNGVLHATLNAYADQVQDWGSNQIEAAMEVADALAVALQNEHSRKQREQSDAALRESEAFLHAVVDAVPLPIFVKDELHRYLLINASGAEWLSWDRQALIGGTDFDLYIEPTAQRHWDEDDQVLAGVPMEAEVALPKADGGTRWVIKRKEAASLPNGRRAVVVCMTDITSRKASQDNVIAARARLQLVNDLSGDIIHRKNFQQISKRAVARLAAHLAGCRVLFSLHSPERKAIVEQAFTDGQFEDVIGEMGSCQQLTNHLDRLTAGLAPIYEHACHDLQFAAIRKIKPKNDAFAYVDVPIYDKDTLCGVISVDSPAARDWTENDIAAVQAVGDVLTLAMQRFDAEARRLSIEAALRDSEATLQAAVWAADVGLWSLDVVANKATWSPQAKGQLGYAAHEIDDHAEIWEYMTHPNDRLRAKQELAQSIKSGSALFESEFRLRRKDGTWGNILVRARIERDSRGRATRLVGGNIDVTEFRRTQEQLRQHRDELESIVAERTRELVYAKEAAESANAAKSEFLANMSHELRTPMHAILSFAQMGNHRAISDAVSREKLKQYFERIDTSAERLLLLLNTLLDLSKLEAGKMTYDIREHDLCQIIDGAVTELSALATSRGVTLQVSTERAPLSLECDALRIGQVVRNLLSNAIKFTPAGRSVTVRAQYGESAGCESLMHFIVSDEGIGIPEDELETVFDKFVQSSKTKSGAGGTGLGLPISREIVTHHQGKIWARNNHNGGAEFHVELPVRFIALTVHQDLNSPGRHAA